MFILNRLVSILPRKLNLAIFSALLCCGVSFGGMMFEVLPAQAADGDGATIAGTITNHEGRPLAWISVVPYRLDETGEFVKVGDEIYGEKTSTTGEYRLDSLTPGTYRIHFVDNNYILNTDNDPNPDTGLVYVSEFYNGATDLASATDIIVGVGQALGSIDEELARAIPAGPEGEAEVTNCSTFGSVGEIGTLADALATANVINFVCSGFMVVPEITVTADLILNGNRDVMLSGNDTNRVMRIFPGIEAEINDLVLTNGSGYVFGGAVSNMGKLTLNGNWVQRSRAGEGGGIYNVGVLLLNNGLLNSNSAGNSAGAIFNYGEVVSVNTKISSSNATGPGAIMNWGKMFFEECVIDGSNSNNGYAIENHGILKFANCTIQNNVSGPVWNDNGTLEIVNSVIDSNGSGRGIIESTGVMTVTDSAITNNWSYTSVSNGGRATLINVTVSGNDGSEGGGIINGATMHIVNSTLTNNTSTYTEFSGIRNDGTLHLSNTIVANQVNGVDCGGSGTIISDGYNLDSDGSCSLTQPTDISNDPANLRSLWDNGGDTFTHALLPDSHAIDAGDCSGGTVTTDQRGVARPQGAACDIGAYELTGNDPIPESPDREALIALYNSTDGDNWLIFNHDDTNWLIGDHCTWYGVTCEEGQVTMLNLRNIRLSGTLPPALGNLVNLTDLTLYDRDLTGPIPPELGNLVKLTSLTLRGGQLTGPIPPDLGNLVNLTNLSLGDDELTGSIPPELGNLVNLQSLFLFQNQLSGPIPLELGNLVNLTSLTLFGNQLTGPIPPELGNLVNLTDLDLRGDQLTGSIPPELGNLVNLTKLNLRGAQLSGSIPPELGNLVNLQDLAIGATQLIGAIPPELSKLVNLELLVLTENQLSGTIPPALGMLIGLKNLYLYNNQLSGAIPPELGNLIDLSTLNLRNNQLSGTIPAELGNLTHLFTLELADNQLGGAISPEIGNLTHLFTLDLANNQFSGSILPEIGNLTLLDILYLNNNQFGGPIPLEMGNLGNLRNLKLDSNNPDLCWPPELQAFPDRFGGNVTYTPPPGGFCDQDLSMERDALIALYNSTVGDNWTNNTDWLVGDYCGWYGITCEEGKVTALSLTENQLNGPISPELGNLLNLKELRLAHNQLSGAIPPELGTLTNLDVLILDNNQLSGAIPPELGNLINLDFLTLEDNQLSGAIPPELGNLTNLFGIRLNRNQLSGAIPPELGNLINLDELSLFNNQLSGTIPPELGNLANLTWLILENNQLSGAIPSELGNLAKLDLLPLSNNQLSGSIPPELGNLANLFLLRLDNNQLSGSIPLEIGKLTNLNELHLHDNDPDLCMPFELQNFIRTINNYSPPPAGYCVQAPRLEQEAEDGTLSGSFAIGNDEAASGGAYAHVPEGFGNRGVNLEPEQKVRYTFNVAEGGLYHIKAWVYAPDVFNNSFYVQIDGAPAQGTLWHTQVNTSYASEYITDGNGADILEVDLNAGEHTVDLFLREDGTRLDKLAIERVGDAPEIPEPEGCEGLEREGEDGELFGNFVEGSDSAASGGGYVHVAEGFGNRGVTLDPMEKASYCFTVDQAGTYRIKGWVYAPDVFNNSFYVQVDGAPTNSYLWHNQVNTAYAPDYVTSGNGVDVVEIELAAGVHTIDVFLREDGTRLDKLALESANVVQSASVPDRPDMDARSEGSQWLLGSLMLADTSMSWQDLNTAILSGAQLTLVDVETEGVQLWRTTGIDLDGGYYFDNVPVGRYEVMVTLPAGYQLIDLNPIVIEIEKDGVVELSHTVVQEAVEELDDQIFLPLVE